MKMNFKKVLASTVLGLTLAPMPAMSIGIGTNVGVGADVNTNVGTNVDIGTQAHTSSNRDTSSARVSTGVDANVDTSSESGTHSSNRARSDMDADVNSRTTLGVATGSNRFACDSDDENCRDRNVVGKKMDRRDMSEDRPRRSDMSSIRAANDNSISSTIRR